MSVSEMLQGERLGEVYPPRPNPDVGWAEARTYALNKLREYLALVEFYRKGVDTPYKIPIADIHAEMPDNVKELRFPCVSIIPGRGVQMMALGGPCPKEDTYGVYGTGSVVVQEAEHRELITLEVMASTKPERSGLQKGIRSAMLPIAGVGALRLKLPEYFNSVCSFEINDTQLIDDPDVVRGRRRNHLYLYMRVPVLRLASFELLEPYTALEQGDGVTGADVD